MLRVVASYGENEYAMATAMRNGIGQILDAMKVEAPQPPGGAVPAGSQHYYRSWQSRRVIPGTSRRWNRRSQNCLQKAPTAPTATRLARVEARAARFLQRLPLLPSVSP